MIPSTEKQQVKNEKIFSFGENIFFFKIYLKVCSMKLISNENIFFFSFINEDCSIVSCEIYRESDRRKSKGDFIGSIDIPLSTINGNQFIEQWYSFQTNKDKSNKNSDGSIQIRIKAKYQTIQILPIVVFNNLQQVCFIHLKNNRIFI